MSDPLPAEDQHINIDGVDVPFSDGETVYEVCSRRGDDVPTLCYDPRLEAFGACRLCVVELDGARNPVASCTTRATSGMAIRTRSDAVEKHRKTLLEMVVSENPRLEADELSGHASQELVTLARRYGVEGGRFEGAHSGKSRGDDDNPFILRDYDQCISCYRCVRVCAEQEGDHAISVMNRGFDTRITTEFNGLLSDSECTFCGQCVQTCPTGALGDKKSLLHTDTPGETVKTRSVCPYCGVGCSVDILSRGDTLVGVRPAMDGPANEGALCIKGQFAAGFVQHRDRLKTPLVRRDDGELHPATWDEALDRAADGLRQVVERRGREALYAVASGRAPHEAAYTMQKIMRAGWGLNHIDNCSRA